MRLLHTSDWHLGRQLHNVSLLDDQRHALQQIVATVRDRKVDAVLVAGDIYDRSVPPAEAVALLDEVIHAISVDCGVPVILIAGNHDGPERMAFGARQLARSGVHITGPLSAELAPVILEDAHGPVAFYSLPYADPPIVREALGAEVHNHQASMLELTNRVRAHNGAARRCVLLAHCFLEGYAASESERPLAVGGVETVSAECFEGFQYVALGHLHGPQARGARHVRYSGSLLKYSFSEVGQQKSMTIVDMDASGSCQVEALPLQPLRDLRVLEGELDDILQRGGSDPDPEDYLLIRITDTRAILDLMSKLRSVYRNVLHVERPGLAGSGLHRAPEAERIKKGELAMFRDFFRDMTGDWPGEAETSVVAGMLERIHRGEGT